MRRIFVLGFFAFLPVLFAACASDERPVLNISALTGITPGIEFDRVVTDLIVNVQGSERSIARAESVAVQGLSYARGFGIAEFSDLPAGDYTVRVTLRYKGRDLVVQRRSFYFGDLNLSVRVVLDRDCIDVACPGAGGSPALSACLQGICVDPRCDPADATTHSYCSTVEFCGPSSECDAVASCATNNCIGNFCITEPITSGPEACADGLWCNPTATTDACQPIPTEVVGDGGTPADLGVCGLVCFVEGNECVTGYWECASGTPVCTGFVFQPSGTSCDEGVCDGAGNCGPEPTSMLTVTPMALAMLEHSNEEERDLTIRVTSSATESVPLEIRSTTPTICTVSADSMARTTITPSEFGEDIALGVMPVDDDVLTGGRDCQIAITLDGVMTTRSVRIVDTDVVRAPIEDLEELTATSGLGQGQFLSIDPTGDNVAFSWDVATVERAASSNTVIVTWNRVANSVAIVGKVGDELPNASSYSPTLGPDGWLAYLSYASNLVDEGETTTENSEDLDVFVEQIGVAGSRRRIPYAIAGERRIPTALPIFARTSPVLLYTQTVDGLTQVFTLDLATNTTELQSADELGVAFDGDSVSLGISENGRFVSFVSTAGPDGPFIGDDAGYRGFIRDRMTGELVMLSDSAIGDVDSFLNSAVSGYIRDDGQFLVAVDGPLAAGDTNDVNDVYAVAPFATPIAITPLLSAFAAPETITVRPGYFANGRIASYSTSDFAGIRETKARRAAFWGVVTDEVTGITRIVGESFVDEATVLDSPSGLAAVSQNALFMAFVDSTIDPGTGEILMSIHLTGGF